MTASDRDAVLRGLIRYAAGLGFCETTVRVVYASVVADSEIVRGKRAAEVRWRLAAAVNV